MKCKPTISFVWFGITGRYGVWRDGLWRAMKRLEEEYTVYYQEPTEEIKGDVILFWEAACTANSKDKEMYLKIQRDPRPKVLLFAGGPIKYEWVDGFDLVCVESKINAKEFDDLGIENITAFGVNEDIMKPMVSDIKYDGMHHATSASWKRQWLMAEALGDKCLVVGRYQETDAYPFDRSRELGAIVMDEQEPEEIAKLLNQCYTLVQTSEYWGGGQRATLEAMACGVPPIVMEDSPKNREYVEESGFGEIVYPNKEEIRRAVEKIKANPIDPQMGVSYIKRKWTSKHYADNLKKAIEIVCLKHQ
jgi:glycosyltransferase involved in cell wall biosynthesis